MSEYINKSIEFLLKELNDWKGSEITIEKKELNDVDKHQLSLEAVAVVNQLYDFDNYVELQTIELQGIGSVITDDGKKHKLPLNSYELPMQELHSIETSNELLTIKTDRATYTIKK